MKTQNRTAVFKEIRKKTLILVLNRKKTHENTLGFILFLFVQNICIFFETLLAESTSNVLKRFRSIKVLYKVLPQFTFTNGKIIIYSKVIELYFSEFITLQESEFKRIYNHCSRHCVDKYTPFRKINCLIQTFMAVRIFVELNRKKS